MNRTKINFLKKLWKTQYSHLSWKEFHRAWKDYKEEKKTNLNKQGK